MGCPVIKRLKKILGEVKLVSSGGENCRSYLFNDAGGGNKKGRPGNLNRPLCLFNALYRRLVNVEFFPEA
jgi:hypothetical protein